jgi:hypothetical protein
MSQLSDQIAICKMTQSRYTHINITSCVCDDFDITHHKYVIFNYENKYKCICKNQHLNYTYNETNSPTYVLCLNTQMVFNIGPISNGVSSTLTERYYKPCISAKSLEAYQEKQISKLLKMYNKLRLILHFDIVRHSILLLIGINWY